MNTYRRLRKQLIAILKPEDYLNLLVASCASMILLSRFVFPGNGYLAFYEDDFFYYLKIAKNIANNGFSSFDNMTLTNGYHPLWLLTILLFILLGQTDISLCLSLSLLTLFLVIITFRLAIKFISHFVSDRLLILALAIVFIERYITLAKSGMEVILTVPLAIRLMLFIIESVNTRTVNDPKVIFKTLCLASLTILSRIDSIILVALAMLGLLLAYHRHIKISAINIFYALLGIVPLIIYFLVNTLYFGSFMPISALAKQLKEQVGISSHTLSSLLPTNPNATSTFIILIFSMGALLFLIYRYTKTDHSISAQEKTVFLSSWFFITHIASVAILSRWVLWPWYTYSILLSFLFLTALLLKQINFKFENTNVSKLLFFMACAYILTWSFAFSVFKKPNDNALYNEAIVLSTWMNDHPGIYAMGDRAGLVGYLSDFPIIQLEGLTMDMRFLENIKDKVSLNTVFKKYTVDYYITYLTFPTNRGYVAYEPAQGKSAGNKYMTGIFKHPPVANFIIQNTHYKIFHIIDD